MIVNSIGSGGAAPTSTFNFKGGALVASGNNATFMSGLTRANMRNGGAIINDGGISITISQPLLHSTIGGNNAVDGGLAKLGSGTVTLTNGNTYMGGTTIQSGILALAQSGSIANSATISISNTAILSVTGRGDQTLTLNSGQTLKGSGSVNGKLNALSGSTVNPGDIIGTLTAQGNITLGGTLLMELNRTNVQNCDELISTSGSIAGGGALTVTNLGPVLQVGDTFQLFNQPVSGFANVNLPNVAPYAWANNLLADGSIKVVAASTISTNITIQVTGNSLVLTWPPDHTGWQLQSHTNSLTGT